MIEQAQGRTRVVKNLWRSRGNEAEDDNIEGGYEVRERKLRE
ncbi:hypothetical protein [Butyrivibrio sp. AE2032]|jgi:hypothetical protein|nr:hypothetical protein [Butyrivibrio sp. AE2032]